MLQWLARKLAIRVRRYFDAQYSDQLRNSLKSCGNQVSLRLPCIIEHPENVTLGDYVSIAPYLHVWGNGGVIIGARTMIASHVAITSATHDPNSPQMFATLETAPVTIANDVWIGSQVVIFPGVNIGQHSVVAAGSIVRSDVPEYTVVAGAPSRVVRVKRR